MPNCLSFVKRVVDSDNIIPLNVNRDTLQESKIINAISKKLVRKVVEMLRKLSENDESRGRRTTTLTKIPRRWRSTRT